MYRSGLRGGLAALARAVGVRFPRAVDGAPRAGLLATTRVGSRHHDLLVKGSSLPEPRDVVSETGVSIGVLVGYDFGEPLFDDSKSALVEPPFGDKHGKSLARLERGAGDCLARRGAN